MRSAFFYYSIIQLCLIIWKLEHLLNVAWWIVLLPTLGPIGIIGFVVILWLTLVHHQLSKDT